MKYTKADLCDLLDKTTNLSITGVSYYPTYEGYTSFNDISDVMQHAPLGAVNLQLSSGQNLLLTSSRYTPDYGLGGIGIKNTDPVDCGPEQIAGIPWRQYQHVNICGYSLYENTFIKGSEKIIVPFGIEFQFNNGRSLFVFDATIESYDPERKIFDLSLNGELTLFFDKNEVSKYPILKENIYNM